VKAGRKSGSMDTTLHYDMCVCLGGEDTCVAGSSSMRFGLEGYGDGLSLCVRRDETEREYD